MNVFIAICVVCCLGGAIFYGIAGGHRHRANGAGAALWPPAPPDPKRELYFGFAAVLAVGGFVLGVGTDVQSPNPAWFATPMIAAIAAALGWIVQRYTSARIARKQHTVNILLGIRQSEVFQANRANALSRFYGGNPLSAAQLEELHAKTTPTDFRADNGRAKVPPADSAAYILNYFEYVAVAVLLGDVDEELIRKSLRGIVVGALAKYWLYAKDKDNLDVAKFGDRPRKEQVPFYNLYALVCYWKLQGYVDENFIEELRPEAIPAPPYCHP